LLRIPEQEEGQIRDASGFFRGEVPRRVHCPFLIHPWTIRNEKECEMIFDLNRTPVAHVWQLMEEASTKTGLSIADIEALINSELETAHVLDYLTAVLTKRMN
jgi:hypothetical protein